MAVYNFCPKCKMAFGLDIKNCPKCQEHIPREGKIFRVAVMVHGKAVKQIVHGSLTAARNIEAKIKTELIEGTYFKRETEQSLTLNEIWIKYCEAKTGAGVKTVYKEVYKYDKMIKNSLGEKDIFKITSSDIEEFRTILSKSLTYRGKVYSQKSIYNAIMLLNAVFNYARKTLKLKIENPCEDVSKPKFKNEVMNILSDDQRESLKKVLNEYANKTIANLIKVLMFTGRRLGELTKLEWRDIDFEKQCYYIRESKSGRSQSYQMNQAAYNTFLKQKELKLKSQIVFPGGESGKISHIDYQWHYIKGRAGLDEKFRLHDLRHDFATQLAAAGRSLYEIQKALGHHSYAMTQRYAHLVDSQLKEAIEVIKE